MATVEAINKFKRMQQQGMFKKGKKATKKGKMVKMANKFMK